MNNTVKRIETTFLGEDCSIYVMNSDNPNTGLTTVMKCPHCKSRYLYNVEYPKREIESDRYCIAIYDVICASCNKEFEKLDIFDKLED